MITWLPEVEEVGALLLSRTTGGDSVVDDVEVGTFDATTRPTGVQVALLIERNAGPHVASRVGTSEDLCNVELTDRARGMTALYAAMLVELIYFPEQVNGNKSAYQEYKTLFDEGMTSLTEAVAEECGEGGDGDVVGGTGPMPSYGFGPYDSVGRDTIW